jgi:hypothetical protein
MPSSPGFAVDLGILIKCNKLGEIADVGLCTKKHKHRSVHNLGLVATQIAAVICGIAEGGQCETTVTQYVNGETNPKLVDVAFLEPIVCEGPR